MGELNGMAIFFFYLVYIPVGPVVQIEGQSHSACYLLQEHHILIGSPHILVGAHFRYSSILALLYSDKHSAVNA